MPTLPDGNIGLGTALSRKARSRRVDDPPSEAGGAHRRSYMARSRSAGGRWMMPGVNVYQREGEAQDWRQVTRADDCPSAEALWLYRTLLLGTAEPSCYEW